MPGPKWPQHVPYVHPDTLHICMLLKIDLKIEYGKLLKDWLKKMKKRKKK